MENENKETGKKAKSNIQALILLILLLLIGGLAGYFFTENKKLEAQLIDCESKSAEITDEKTQVMGELEAMLVKYDTLSAENEGMREKLIEEQAKIEKLIQEAKNKNWTIAKLKKETATLRNIMQGYVQTIDSLNTLTINLREEKAVIKKELGKEVSKNNTLAKENEGLANKVKIGQRLEAMDISVLAQRIKSNNVHRETTKASKTNKIKICFTLDKNEIAEAGKRTLYVRIIAPDATVLPVEEGDGKFKFSGATGYYSLKREIEYNTQEQDFCFYYDVIGTIPVGKYICEIYEGESNIGKATLQLK